MAADRQAVDAHGPAPLQRAADGQGIRPRHVPARDQGPACREVNPKSQSPNPKSQSPKPGAEAVPGSNPGALGFVQPDSMIRTRFTGLLIAICLAAAATTTGAAHDDAASVAHV